jgi:hypothetical protein
MAEKVTDIVVTFAVQTGTEQRPFRRFEQDVQGAQFPVDDMREVPILETRTLTYATDVRGADVGAFTDDAIADALKRAHGPHTALIGVEHIVRVR